MALYDEMGHVAAQASDTMAAADSYAPAAPVTPHLYSGADLHESVRAAAEDFSIEVLPKTAHKVKNFAHILPRGSRVFIPFLPGARFSDCVPLAMRLRREGMEPIPHIAARRLRSQSELTETVDHLRNEANITKCLVIAGDPATPSGPFVDSMALLEMGVLEKAGIETIFVGGQPEGIPGVAAGDVETALLRKNDYARQTSASMRLVTQFTLDINAFVDWNKRLAEIGNTMPIHAGIAGPTSLTSLLKFAALTGASASLRAMRRYGAKLTQLASEAAPDAFITHLAAKRLSADESDKTGFFGQHIAGLHVYTFGGFSQAANWMMSLQNGRFAMNAERDGFTVS